MGDQGEKVGEKGEIKREKSIYRLNLEGLISERQRDDNKKVL